MVGAPGRADDGPMSTSSHPTAWPSATSDGLRVGHAERERAVSALQDAFAEGRLDTSELDERIEAALAARTRADLAAALRGLPLTGQVTVPGGPTSRTGPTLAPRAGAPAPLERSWAMVAHWSGVLTFFVGPMVIAATKGKISPYVRAQAREAANFQLTFLGASVALALVTAVTFGAAAFFFPLLGFTWLVLSGVGGLAAATGNAFRYPWSLRPLR